LVCHKSSHIQALGRALQQLRTFESHTIHLTLEIKYTYLVSSPIIIARLRFPHLAKLSLVSIYANYKTVHDLLHHHEVTLQCLTLCGVAMKDLWAWELVLRLIQRKTTLDRLVLHRLHCNMISYDGYERPCMLPLEYKGEIVARFAIMKYIDDFVCS
jgi:hypothetical protein